MEQQVDWIAQVFHEPWIQIQQITSKQEIVNATIDSSQQTTTPQQTILSSYHVQLSNQKQILVSMEHGKTIPNTNSSSSSSSRHSHRFSLDHSSHRFSSTTTNTSASTEVSISNSLDITKPFCLRLYVVDSMNTAKEFLRIERAAYTHKNLICIFGIKQIVYQSSEPHVPFTPPSSRRNVNPFSFQFSTTNPTTNTTTTTTSHQYSDYELQLLGMIQLHSKVKHKKWKLHKSATSSLYTIPSAIWNPFFNQKLFTILQKQNTKTGFSLHQWWNKMKSLHKQSSQQSQSSQQQQSLPSNTIVLQKCNSEGSSELQSMTLYQQEENCILLESISSDVLSNEEKALLFSFVLLIKIANKK